MQDPPLTVRPASGLIRGGEESATVSLSVVIPTIALDHATLTSRTQIADLPCVREVIFVAPEVPEAPNSDSYGSHVKIAPSVAHAVGDDLAETRRAEVSGTEFHHDKIRRLRAPLGRASQMNAGAAAAHGSHLLFLHGDTEVATAAVAALAEAIAAAPDKAFAFTHRFASNRRILGLLSQLGALRDRLLPFPLGDQGLAVERRLFLDLGGYPDEPFCEDVIMTWRLGRHTGWSILPQLAVTSADRFERRGIWRTLFENSALLTLFTLGISPQLLVRFYYGDDYLERWRSARTSRRTTATTGRLLRWIGLSVVVISLGAWLGTAAAVDHSHALLDSVLGRHVRDGLVDYTGLQVEAHDPDSDFSVYLTQLSAGTAAEESTWTLVQRLAYWVNAYNAFTLKLIVDHYPIAPRWYMYALPFLSHWMPRNSILQIPGRWDNVTFATVRGHLTLDDMEHQILRPEFADPRIHFAIVCASVGCPSLQSHAYHPATIAVELDAATTEFMATQSKVTWNPARDSLQISKIFAWFRNDFTVAVPADRPRLPTEITDRYGKEAGVVRWLIAYGPAGLPTWLKTGSRSIDYLPYDWKLNEQPSFVADHYQNKPPGRWPGRVKPIAEAWDSTFHQFKSVFLNQIVQIVL